MNVYCIDFPNNKRYVGVESNTGKRKSQHSKGYKQTLVGRAISKYGWENCKFRYLIINATPETCYHIEKKLIKLWKLQDRKKGYNISSGGECAALGHKQSEKTIKKRIESRKDYKPSKKTKEKISNSLKGRKHTKERRLNQSKAKNGREFKVYKIVKYKGTPRNWNSFEILKEKYIGTWISQTECAEDLNINRCKIGACLNKNRKTHKFYKFKYVT